MARAVIIALLAVFALTCTPRTPVEKLASLADKTRVCVDNPTMHNMRVEILGTYSRHEFGEIRVMNGRETCEWMSLPESISLDARIKSVSVHRDVIPPAWTRMVVGPGSIILVAGADGLTPFAHSFRRR